MTLALLIAFCLTVQPHFTVVLLQTYELWFKQILHELKSVVAIFDSE